MSSYIDLKFINEISARLGHFKKKGDYLFNFRCPHCGDSQKSKLKSRGYFYRVKNDMFFKCHNCGMGQNLANFLKFIDPKVYEQYLLERYKTASPATPKPEFKYDFKPDIKDDFISDLTKIADLDKEHPARKVVEKRLIPEKFYDKLYLCNKFYSWAHKIAPRKYNTSKYDHPRLVIPFYDEQGKVFAYQGRAFGNETPKYVTIKLDENKQKIFGLERVNYTQHIFVVEGPIDSLFLDNCIAAGGADLTLDSKIDPSKVTYIFDNEPRNKEIVSRMEKIIEQGYNIFIWPNDIQLKDVNDLIMTGVTKVQLSEIISINTYSKLSASQQLITYKKV
ncbi:MAG: hypothetical protein CMH03_00210 [Marinovum sp.]|nr:hypothetical protein [Marinovum sp.]|tara:strand:- start:7186 stop:8190 length:1005 start_codon:yes stop_codon:yes gene_type:complete